MNIGFRLRNYKPFTIRANYTTDRSRFAETNLSATSTGLWIDYNYFIIDFGTLSIDIGNGLDVDIANLKMDTVVKNDNDDSETEIYNASSDITTISLRTNLNFNLYFDPIGFQLSTSVLLPLSGTATDSIETNDTENVDYLGETTQEEDVREL